MARLTGENTWRCEHTYLSGVTRQAISPLVTTPQYTQCHTCAYFPFTRLVNLIHVYRLWGTLSFITKIGQNFACLPLNSNNARDSPPMRAGNGMAWGSCCQASTFSLYLFGYVLSKPKSLPQYGIVSHHQFLSPTGRAYTGIPRIEIQAGVSYTNPLQTLGCFFRVFPFLWRHSRRAEHKRDSALIHPGKSVQLS